MLLLKNSEPSLPEIISGIFSYDEETADGIKQRIFKIPGLDDNLCMRWDAGGKPYLYSDLISLSDIHLGTRQCQAKVLSHFFEFTNSENLLLLGDIIDGLRLLAKKERNIAEWHRKAIVHVRRKVAKKTKVIYVPGNHDHSLRPKNIEYQGILQDGKATNRGWVSRDGKVSLYPGFQYAHRAVCDRNFARTKTLNEAKTFMGIHIIEEYEQLIKCMENGKEIVEKMLAEHGDKRENIHPAWYFLGDKANEFLGFLDEFFVIPVIWRIFKTKFLLAEWAKRKLKVFLKNKMGTINRIGKAIDEMNEMVFHLSGHTHIPGADRSPGGRLIINGGSSTGHECVKGVAIRDGKKTRFEWHRNGINLIDMNNKAYFVSWDVPGLECFKVDPTPLKDAIPNRNKAFFHIKLWRFIQSAPRQGMKKARQAWFGKTIPKAEDIQEDEFIHDMYRMLRFIDYVWPSKSHRSKSQTLHRQVKAFSDEAFVRRRIAHAAGKINDETFRLYCVARTNAVAASARHTIRHNVPELPDRQGPVRAARREEAEKRRKEAERRNLATLAA